MNKLITELQTIDGITEKQATLIAEYIFRGVEPLVKYKEKYYLECSGQTRAMDKSLKLAGADINK